MPKTIALIDDDEAVRDSLGALLASAGFAVRAYMSAAAYLEAADGVPADGVVLDHQMPGQTGVELAERLARDGHAIPIVLISGNLNDRLRARARRAGVAAILEKPFSDEALIAAVEDAVQAG